MSLEETTGEGTVSGIPFVPKEELLPVEYSAISLDANLPQARARFSGSGSFDGAYTRPSHPEDELEVSLDKLKRTLDREPEDSDRIATKGVLAAVLYMRSAIEKEKGVAAHNRTVDPASIDVDEAMVGLCWIQANVDEDFGGELRDAAIDHKRTINGLSKPNKPHNDEPTTAQLPAEKLRDEHARKRASKKEKHRREQAERQQQHEAARQSEIELLQKWQQEHPPMGTNYLVEALDFFETRETPSGKITVVKKEGQQEKLLSYLRYAAENPQVLASEVSDSNSLDRFLEENEAPILAQVLEEAKVYAECWDILRYNDPEKIKAIFPKWLKLFDSFSQRYKSGMEFKLDGVDNNDALQSGDAELETEAVVHNHGNRFLSAALMSAAESHPDEFVDLAYELAQQAVDMDDPFIRKNFFSILSYAHVSSRTANILLVNAPIAKNLDDATILKSLDLGICIANAGLHFGTVDYGDQVSSKVRKQYCDIKGARSRLGISRKNRVSEQTLIRVASVPYAEQIKSGEFPNSLYHKTLNQGEEHSADSA